MHFQNWLKKFESLINEFLILLSRNIDVGQVSVNVSVNAEETDDNLHKTGILSYSASVNDRIIGLDKYTEVRIQPQHHLTNIFIRWFKWYYIHSLYILKISYLYIKYVTSVMYFSQKTTFKISGQENAEYTPAQANYSRCTLSRMSSV